MNNRQGAGRSPTYHPRFLSLSLASTVFAICPLLIGSTAAAQVVIPISGCNFQRLADGDKEIFWTSSFATDAYVFDEDENSRSGEVVSGTGDTLEVTVQWSTSDPEATSSSVAFGPRGAGFSPGGVDGVVDFAVEPNPSPEDPEQCDVDILAPSYGSFTFTLTCTSLHKPARRGGGIAKGNAQFEVDVAVGDEVVSLGTNVHVATGTDPEE